MAGAHLFAPGMAVVVGDWLNLLRTGAEADAEFRVLLGKGDPPSLAQGTMMALMYGGVVRCRLPFKRLAFDVYGTSLVLSGAAIAAATPVTVPPELLFTRWSAMTERPPPTTIWFPGCRECWWMTVDELPFPTWMSAGLSHEDAAAARVAVAVFGSRRVPSSPPPKVAARVASPPPPADEPPVATAPPAKPVKPSGPQGSLF